MSGRVFFHPNIVHLVSIHIVPLGFSTWMYWSSLTDPIPVWMLNPNLATIGVSVYNQLSSTPHIVLGIYRYIALLHIVVETGRVSNTKKR